MKTLFLFFFLCSYSVATVWGQGIHFETGTYEDALAKAKAENKLLFIDVYTTVCGPCKKMERETFVQSNVGGYFNEHYINYQQDLHKGNGPELGKKFNIAVVPTFLFLDGNGDLVFQFSGYYEADEFLNKVFRFYFSNKYGGEERVNQLKAGEGDVQFFAEYYPIASPQEKPQILNNYLKSMPTEQLLDAKTGLLLREVTIFDSGLFLRIARNLGEEDELSLDYRMDYYYPFWAKVNDFFCKSIEQADAPLFQNLLELKKIWDRDGRGNSFGVSGTQLLYSSMRTLHLKYACDNEVQEDYFQTHFPEYMAELMKAIPLDTAYKACMKSKEWIGRQNPLDDILGLKTDPKQMLMTYYRYITSVVVEWCNHYWLMAPSDKTVKADCAEWLKYACEMNLYDPEIVMRAAPLLVRLKQKKTVVGYLNKAIEAQEEIKNEDPKLMKRLRNTLWQVENDKY